MHAFPINAHQLICTCCKFEISFSNNKTSSLNTCSTCTFNKVKGQY